MIYLMLHATLNYAHIVDKQQAMRKYLCDSNVIMCLKTTKDTHKCLNDQRQCYENSEIRDERLIFSTHLNIYIIIITDAI